MLILSCIAYSNRYGAIKIKKFFQKYKKLLLNIGLLLLAFLAISVVALLVFMAFDVIYFDDGMKFNANIFNKFKTSWYGVFIFIGVQILFTTLLCFIPGTSMTFILLSKTFYKNPLDAFFLSIVSVFLSSLIMYTVGRFGGYKLCAKMLGKEDCEKASNLLNTKGLIYFPLMMLFPAFPDDALIMIAGTLKMSLKWFIPSVVVGRSIGIATIIFGLEIIPFNKFTSVFHWIIFIAICLLLLVAVLFLASKFNKYLEKRREEKNKEV